MKRRVTVLIDLDDTMTHLVNAWCQWLNRAHGTTVSEDDITDWDIAQFFPSLSEEQIFEPIHTDEFWWQVEPKSDASHYMKLLADEGFDVYVCTSSGFDTIKSKFEAILRRHFPFITRQNIIVAQNKQLINGDILIDDGVHNLEGWCI